MKLTPQRRLELLEAAAEATSELIFATDLQGRYLYYNRACCRLFRLSDTEMLGRTNADLFGAEIAARLAPNDQQVLERLEPASFEIEVPTADGSIVLNYEKRPLYDGQGELIGLLNVAQDVTAARRLQATVGQHRHQLESAVAARTLALTIANDALQQAARFNTTITDAMPGHVAYFDVSLHCRFANRSYAEWFGQTPESVVGLSSTQIAGPRYACLHGPLLDAVQGAPQRFERDTAGPDSKPHFQQVHMVPDVDAAGQVHGVLLMSFDITALKDAESALMRTNAQLEAARDKAEAANRAKSAFLANMSHEIRTPLNAVIGMTHLMTQEVTEPRQQDRLAKVDAAAQHLLRILNDILDLSKIEAGKLTLEQRDFSLHGVIRQATDILETSAQRKGLAMRVEIEPLPDLLCGDATRLSQLLMNLLSNAIKFTEQGWVRLHARVAQSEAQRVQLHFEVQDTGVGIPAGRQPELFHSFEQGDSSTTRRYGGTGLGLALVRQLAEAMGGEAGCTSQVGQGSSFWASVWLTRAPQTSAPRPQAAQDRRGGGRGRLDDALGRLRLEHHGRQVLLVEDNPVNQEVAKDLLALAGLQVTLAADGIEALAMACAGRHDLVLMDLEMPGLDGLSTARALRQRGMALPIIAMTAHATPHDLQASLHAGMNGHITKPVNPVALYESLLASLAACAPAG